MNLTLPPPGVEALLLTLVLGAAAYDLLYRRIPNWLTLGGAVLGVALNTFLYQGWPGLRFSMAGMALAFGIYLVLYALRAMGAGDVKLMAAVGSIVGWENWFGIFVITAIIGGVMSLILATSFLPEPTTRMSSRPNFSTAVATIASQLASEPGLLAMVATLGKLVPSPQPT